MKIAIAFISVFVVLGIVYGLARVHVIRLQGLAKSSPAIGKLLLKLSLVPPVHAKPSAVLAAAAPPPDPFASEKQKIAAEQAQVDQEKQDLASKATASVVTIIPTAPQMVEIYEAMNSDDLVTLFAKEPDSTVVSALIAMDSKKAAKALAAMPPDRAVKITALMNRAMSTADNSPQPPTS